ncbi:succinate dehydrogenase/fumarate reductase iron-sulfur subunit [Candidatus Latescibacterota bacterium]
MEYAFTVFRCDPEVDDAPRFDTFTLEARGNQSVLEALIQIRDTQDGSLSFRYSCRGAICGSCAMMINGQPDLACRVQLQALSSPEVTVEPLANLEIVKDLVVDMEPFWAAYRRVQPFLQGAAAEMDDDQSERLVEFAKCVLCACCYSACPVVGSDEDYAGPAALAKLYRFVADPRDQRDYAALQAVDNQRGAWGCRTVFRCVEACPKQVRPVDGVEGLRRKLMGARLKAAMGKQR